MKIVIDTNVVASAIFFGGKPLELIRFLLTKEIEAIASPEIVKEYLETTEYLLHKYQGQNIKIPLMQITSNLIIVEDSNNVHICRDPDDDKFLSCAIHSNSFYIVSGDKDLLVLKTYKNVQIITVSEFLEIYYLKNHK